MFRNIINYFIILIIFWQYIFGGLRKDLTVNENEIEHYW